VPLTEVGVLQERRHEVDAGLDGEDVPGQERQVDAQARERVLRRLAAGQDLGTVPARFMVGAARYALDQRLAQPQAITDTFFRMLGRR
jgi:hypothetical protein